MQAGCVQKGEQINATQFTSASHDAAACALTDELLCAGAAMAVDGKLRCNFLCFALCDIVDVAAGLH